MTTPTSPRADETPAPPPRPKDWFLAPIDVELGRFLSDKAKVDPVVGQLLVNRGCKTIEDAERFLDRKLKSLHDPTAHPGIVEAADRVYAALRANKKICIYGDYDVDGMCATSILLECLRLAGAEPTYYIPDRFEEGYGVNASALTELKSQGIDLVITVDCGIASVHEAEHARALGLEYIVTDHHEMKEQLPPADTLVHPRLPGSNYPFGQLCGTGVAFKLAWEIARRASGGQATTPAFKKFLLAATSLTAIGTVCDVVPLADENRVLVHHGLAALKASPPLGLNYLIKQAGLQAKPKLTAEDVAFTLGPRLNACGRLGQARLGVELLTTRDNKRAAELALYLDERNAERQTIERRTFLEARDLAESQYNLASDELPSAFVLASENWHPGVIGIVASRMVERYHRPCIMIALGSEDGTGSGRSIAGIHLAHALAGCKDHLVTAGGHAMAAGLRLKRHNLEPFRDALDAQIRSQTAGDAPRGRIDIDLEVPLRALTPKLVRALEILEPFGCENPKPLFLATNLQLVGDAKIMGGGGRHLAFRVKQGDCQMRAVAFGQAENLPLLQADEGKCCVVFEPMINEFRGYPEVELKVRDFRPGPTLERLHTT